MKSNLPWVQFAISQIYHVERYNEHQQKNKLEIHETQEYQVQIGEIDGSMIPIVRINKEVADKRKSKTLEWKEARLAITHKLGSMTDKFCIVFQSDVNNASQALLDSAILSGFAQQKHFHSVVMEQSG